MKGIHRMNQPLVFQATDCQWFVADDVVEPAGCDGGDITSDSPDPSLQV